MHSRWPITKSGPGSLSVAAGELVTLVCCDDDDDEWITVAKASGEVGIVPRSFFDDDDAAGAAAAADDGTPSDDSEDALYFEEYGHNMNVHWQMLNDDVRMDSYLRGIAAFDLRGKVVLDVGCGTGVLSLFAARAGAKRVYAVEASAMAAAARELVAANGCEGVVHVIHGRMEDVTLPCSVDVILSEWMGTVLFYESMLEPVLIARDRWLKPGGLILPGAAALYVAPIAVPEMWRERVDFWRGDGFSDPAAAAAATAAATRSAQAAATTPPPPIDAADALGGAPVSRNARAAGLAHYGLDFSALEAKAKTSFFARPLDPGDRHRLLPANLVGASARVLHLDLYTCATGAAGDGASADDAACGGESDEEGATWERFSATVRAPIQQTTPALHGVVCWFDVYFVDAERASSAERCCAPPEDDAAASIVATLTTSPWQRTTHWGHTVCLLDRPIVATAAAAAAAAVEEIPSGAAVTVAFAMQREEQSRRYTIELGMTLEKGDAAAAAAAVDLPSLPPLMKRFALG